MFRSLLSKLCYPDSDDFDVVPEVHAIQAIARMAPVRPVKPSVLANMMSFLYNPPPQATYHLVRSQEITQSHRCNHIWCTHVAAEVPSLRSSCLTSVAQLIHILLLDGGGESSAAAVAAVVAHLPKIYKSDILAAFLNCVPSSYHWESDCRAKHVYQSWTTGFSLLFHPRDVKSLHIPSPVSVLANHIYLNMDQDSSKDHYFAILEATMRTRKPPSFAYYQDALQDLEYLHQMTAGGTHFAALLSRVNNDDAGSAGIEGLQLHNVTFETECNARIDNHVLNQVHSLVDMLEAVQHLDLSDLVNDDTLRRIGLGCPVLKSLKIKGLNVNLVGLENLVSKLDEDDASSRLPTKLCNSMEEIDISRCLNLRCDSVALLLRSLPRLKSITFLRKETDLSLLNGGASFTSALEELDVWSPVSSAHQLHTLVQSFPWLRSLRLFGSVVVAEDTSSCWDMLPHLTSLAVRVKNASLIDVILRSRLGQQLNDLSILVKPDNLGVNDDFAPPVGPIQINLYQICLLAPNLKHLKIDMPCNYSRDPTGSQTSVIYNTACQTPTPSSTSPASSSCRLQKIEVAGLDEISVDGLKSLLSNTSSLTEVRLRDACYVLTDTSSWLMSMIEEDCLSNVQTFNLISTEKLRELPGLSTQVLSMLIEKCSNLVKIGEINQWGINMKEAKSVAVAKGWCGTITYTHLQQEVIYDSCF